MIGSEIADVQRRRRAVVADVADGLALGGQRIEAGEIGALVDEAALVERVEKVGLDTLAMALSASRGLSSTAGDWPTV